MTGCDSPKVRRMKKTEQKTAQNKLNRIQILAGLLVTGKSLQLSLTRPYQHGLQLYQQSNTHHSHSSNRTNDRYTATQPNSKQKREVKLLIYLAMLARSNKQVNRHYGQAKITEEIRKD